MTYDKLHKIKVLFTTLKINAHVYDSRKEDLMKNPQWFLNRLDSHIALCKLIQQRINEHEQAGYNNETNR